MLWTFGDSFLALFYQHGFLHLPLLEEHSSLEPLQKIFHIYVPGFKRHWEFESTKALTEQIKQCASYLGSFSVLYIWHCRGTRKHTRVHSKRNAAVSVTDLERDEDEDIRKRTVCDWVDLVLDKLDRLKREMMFSNSFDMKWGPDWAQN